MTAHPTQQERETARELVKQVQHQNWKLGGVLTTDTDEAENLIAQALADARAEALREAQRAAEAMIDSCRIDGESDLRAVKASTTLAIRALIGGGDG